MSKRPFLLLFVLLTYVLLQFCWWTYLLLDLSQEVATYQSASGGTSSAPQKQLMVLGEGLVFLLALLLGAFFLLRGLRREWRVARLQRNFLMAVSHEMHSPIASMKLYLQTLEKRQLNKEDQTTVVQGALSSADRLRDLADNIMMALRIDDGSLELQLQETSLREMSEEVIQGLQETLAQDRQILLKADGPVYAKVDPQAYRSVLVNLLENAIKYSPKGSNIEVEITDGAMCTLTVKDHGIGIRQEDQRAVFQRFFRAGDEATRSSTGTGLGLYIVKNLCEAMGGKIELDSEAGKGSTFTATFQP